jgi:flagellar biosynthesis protein FliQ
MALLSKVLELVIAIVVRLFHALNVICKNALAFVPSFRMRALRIFVVLLQSR